ncbi:MAG: hypothetical protein B6D61_13030 [Bacteroidetes bacterium 4484_249]|nr:MAG: hypothetical protein B6D61_13030 [Bacteroidetes bacterium 4484_249]RKY77995.1 MAG: hypothetical protein DRQ07_08080 [candidate division KSB1 bacterium]
MVKEMMYKSKSIIASVVVITYNHKLFIQKALDSVLMQKTNFDYEIVIGDDCSTDGTMEIIDGYAKKYSSKIRVLKSEINLGATPNFSRTFKACRGKYIAVLEGDDYWIQDNKLQLQIDLMESHDDFSLCFTNRNIVDENKNEIKENTIPENLRTTLTYKSILTGVCPPMQTLVIRSKFLDDQFYDNLPKVYNGDIFISSFLSTKGKVGFLNLTTAVYRINANGVYSKENYFNRLSFKLNTYNILKNTLKKKYHVYLEKAEVVILQRMFVLLLLKGNILGHFRIAVKLLSHDIRTADYSLLRAFKLLFLKGLNPFKQVTD